MKKAIRERIGKARTPVSMACDTARWRRKGFPLNGATKV